MTDALRSHPYSVDTCTENPRAEDLDVLDNLSKAALAGESSDVKANPAVLNAATEANPTNNSWSDKLYTTFTIWQTRTIVLTACLAATFSPFTGQAYFPALNTIAKDLHVSPSKVNLTITTYMIFQAVAPCIIGAISDASGRRPAYIVCFSLYLVANIALALQHNYAALLVLRCIQSSGSSGTVALVNAVITDVATTAERGSWIGYSSIASIVGPSLGPVVGGLLSRYLGWRSIFWFLAIAAAAFFIPFLLFFPETGRSVVGDGSIPSPKLNRPLMKCILHRRANGQTKSTEDGPVTSIVQTKRRSVNPFGTLKILSDKETFIILSYASLLFAGFYAVCAAVPSQFSKIYGFNDVQLGLTFIPIGCGSIAAAFTNGKLIDYNFGRHAKRVGLPLGKNRQQDLRMFPVERARLEIAVPFLYLASAAIVAFGWVLHARTHISAPIVLLFVQGYSMIAGFNTMAVLVVDIHRDKPATASAADDLTRCLVGAVVTAVANPIIEGIGVGWAFTLVGLLYLVFSPVLWVIMRSGMGWRQERVASEERKDEAKEMKRRESRREV